MHESSAVDPRHRGLYSGGIRTPQGADSDGSEGMFVLKMGWRHHVLPLTQFCPRHLSTLFQNGIAIAVFPLSGFAL